MTATTNAPRARWVEPTPPMPVPAAPPATASSAARATASSAPPASRHREAPIAGSIEELGRQLLEETNAVRCVAYRRNRSGQLIWQHEVAADDAELAGGGATLADQVEASRRAPVQITEPVRDAFGQIIGVIQTRQASDPTF